MSGPQARLGWGLIFAVLGCAAVGLSIGQAQPKKEAAAVGVESILPADTVLYVGVDGASKHKAAWEKTAAYEALYSSGLMDAFTKTFQAMSEKGNTSPEMKEQAKEVQTLVTALGEQGASFVISIPTDRAPLPQVMLVAHEFAPHEPVVRKYVEKLAGEAKLKFETKEIEGRSAQVALIPDSPGIEVGWYTEGNHLVIVAGINAAETAIGVAAGKRENITNNPNWAKYRTAKTDYEVTAVSWLDVGKLRKIYGDMDIPKSPDPQKPIKVNQALEALGLDTLGTIVSKQGYKGKSVWSETFMEAPGPRKGLLALADQKAITMKDLPPIPWGTHGFGAGSIDASKAYDEILATVQKVAKLGPEDTATQVEGHIKQIPAIVGFDPKADLLDTFGNVYGIYTDTRNNFFGMDVSVVVQVKDADRLRKTITDLIGRLSEQANPNDVKVVKTKKHGREILTFEVQKGVFNPSLVVDDKWLCIGLYPQSVEAFVLRLDKKLASWEPSESFKDALGAVPKEFTSITVSDPRQMYRSLVGLGPVLLPALKQGLAQSRVGGPDLQIPLSLADLPPAELVARPLFPNVATVTLEEEGVRWTSRSSLPAFPMIGNSSVTTAAVAVALILPAVQQAREAARRAQSKNNMKQMALAIHNYADAHRNLPQGTIEPNGKDLKPEERLSWLTSILPYIEQGALYERVDANEGFEAEKNSLARDTRIVIFENPGYAGQATTKHGSTHYVGIGGLGKDGPTLPANNPKAGMFAYNRKTRFADVTDGLSNTLMIGEISKEAGPWARGGDATIRAFTSKPYLKGPDGIGGPFRGGGHFALGDGSVRFISENVDPSVIEAMSTISGGEVVP